MIALRSEGTDAVQSLRRAVLEHAINRAPLSPGLFTMTVPTGGGKTLASLSFALEHAVQHGLRRVVYVIPFTSIIEQTAAVFRHALGSDDDVLEHHAAFDWGDPSEDAGSDGLRKLRYAAENWDVPIVVTTAVQFFESLFASRPSSCRKLHNLAGAVIVLDEAQTLPLHVLRPCMAALDELARNFGASIVLCTATQPALTVQDEFPQGFAIGPERELAPDPKALYTALKRVRVVVRPEPTGDAQIASRFADQPQMLCIVNSRAHARTLYEAIAHQAGAMHLSTLMCPVHRRAVLAEARERLAGGEFVRLVSTSLIEAGVDISLPEVWRAAAGLDSIAQAAGRCNRHGLLAEGRVVVFTPETFKPPHAVEAFWQAARPILARHEDLLGLDAVREYFRELYWQKGEAALDTTMVRDARGVMRAIAAGAEGSRFPFRSIAEAFHLIDEPMESVIVPFDDTAKDLLRRIAAAERPPTVLLRRLQGYAVSIPNAARLEWMRRGALSPVHPVLGDGLLCFGDDAHYRPETGLDLSAIGLRAAEANIV
jgi:CRISPR-associated endonuclease/helicase Cas3